MKPPTSETIVARVLPKTVEKHSIGTQIYDRDTGSTRMMLNKTLALSKRLTPTLRAHTTAATAVAGTDRLWMVALAAGGLGRGMGRRRVWIRKGESMGQAGNQRARPEVMQPTKKPHRQLCGFFVEGGACRSTHQHAADDTQPL